MYRMNHQAVARPAAVSDRPIRVRGEPGHELGRQSIEESEREVDRLVERGDTERTQDADGERERDENGVFAQLESVEPADKPAPRFARLGSAGLLRFHGSQYRDLGPRDLGSAP